jgi:hypothetical protein
MTEEALIRPARRRPAIAPRPAFAIVLGALVLPLPALVQVMQSGPVKPAIPAGEWLGEPVLGRIHAMTGLPATVALWLLPLLVAGLAWVLPAGVERLVRALRIDPHDHAWTSFTWALRSWRGALRWLAIVLLPTLALAAAWWGLAEADVPVVSEWLGEVEAEQVLAVLWLSVSFFLLDARNYAHAVPPRRWSARWPTRQVWLLYGVVLAAAGLLYLLGLHDLQSWIDAQSRDAAGIAKILCVVAFAWTLALLLSWTIDLAWLSRAGWSGLPSVWRRGLHPRVFAASALQWVRASLYFLLALLPIVAWGWFFVAVVPQAEETLADHGLVCCMDCCGPDGFWPAFVGASRWMVKWWWALGLGFLAVVSVVLKCLLPWFGDVAWARLMVERNVVAAVPTAGAP